jgi:hypothetical protein
MTPRVVTVQLPLACLVHAAVTLGAQEPWVSTAAATLVAWLLWRHHQRARFAAYIFFSVLAVRGALTARWPMLIFAVAAVLVMQTPPALIAWPRLRPGWRRGSGDRMRRS